MPNLLNNKMNIVNIICILLLVALIVVLIVCLVKNNEQFGEHHNNEDEENCEVLMYHGYGCPFSDKMLKKLKENNMKIGNMKICVRNINHPDANKHGALSTPTLVNKNNPNMKSVGFNENLNKVENDLNGKNEHVESKTNNGSNIKVYGNTRCPYCNRTIELLNKLGISYDFLETDKPEHAKAFKNLNGNGVPLLIVSDNNGNQIKRIEGFNIKKINELKN